MQWKFLAVHAIHFVNWKEDDRGKCQVSQMNESYFFPYYNLTWNYMTPHQQGLPENNMDQLHPTPNVTYKFHVYAE